MYVYIEGSRGAEASKYHVGFYMPNGNYYYESEYDTAGEAATRVNYLNGGKGYPQR